MFKAQARYLLERAEGELWTFVLNESNMYRRSLVDAVVATAVPGKSRIIIPHWSHQFLVPVKVWQRWVYHLEHYRWR